MANERLKILNSKEIKAINTAMFAQFGCCFGSFVFLENAKQKIFITNMALSKIDLDQLRVNSIGLYVGEFKDNKMRLSIEGAQLIASNAEKNILELDEAQSKTWMAGLDIPVTKSGFAAGEFIILKHKMDVFGCGKFNGEKIFNYIPKERRLKLNTPS